MFSIEKKQKKRRKSELHQNLVDFLTYFSIFRTKKYETSIDILFDGIIYHENILINENKCPLK